MNALIGRNVEIKMKLFPDKRKSVGSGTELKAKVFISGPFTLALDGKGKFHEETASRLTAIIRIIEETGRKFFSSQIAEAWGDELEEPESLSKRDIEELREASHFIAYAGSVPSLGTWIEMGMAVIIGIPVLICMEKGIPFRSDFLKGLVDQNLIELAEWVSEEDIRKKILLFLRNDSRTKRKT